MQVHCHFVLWTSAILGIAFFVCTRAHIPVHLQIQLKNNVNSFYFQWYHVTFSFARELMVHITDSVTQQFIMWYQSTTRRIQRISGYSKCNINCLQFTIIVNYILCRKQTLPFFYLRCGLSPLGMFTIFIRLEFTIIYFIFNTCNV